MIAFIVESVGTLIDRVISEAISILFDSSLAPTMSKLEPLGGSYSHVGDEADIERDEFDAASDASSLASLLNDGVENELRMSRMQMSDTVGHALDPQRWPLWKKLWVAITIAFYT